MADKYAHLRPARPRSCFNASGQRKVSYDTQTRAENAAAEVGGQTAYRCPNCPYWHTATERHTEGAA